ncbi:LysE family translocator [Kaustia mangrovi]|uniref:LysE family translocator n=1 Tax=Kaustia mangrovi TaxID=2593653 RepID=A0A7S8C3N7_9HYPH|nr:LysE family translocator [Kaustia mangrovi]QPC42771.1 LysE family translocator [Kaustia mangrovi]
MFGSSLYSELGIIYTTLGVYALVVVSPGPAFTLVAQTALSGQARVATGAIVGLASAAAFYAALSMAGLLLVVQSMGWALRVLQVLGGAYLIWLGVKIWREQRSGHVESTHGNSDTAQRIGFGAGMWRGMMVNLSNPKAVVFFVSIYAVAIPEHASLATRLAILAGGFLMELAWYGVSARLLSTHEVRRRYLAASTAVNRVLAGAMVLFGIKTLVGR